MHSGATDRRSRTVAMDGLARDAVGYPVVGLGLALLAGAAVGSPIVGVLALVSVAVGGLTAIVGGADDLGGEIARAYVAPDPAPRARVATALLSTVVWAGGAVVVLALA